MYKVFFNSSSLLIGPTDKKSSKCNITKIIDCEDDSFLRQIIAEIEFGKKAIHLNPGNRDVEKLWNSFRNLFRLLPAAGGLVKSDAGSLLFIKRLGVWDLPKGKIDKDEAAESAAIREVQEECGLMGLKIIRQLNSTYHIYRSPYLTPPDNLVLKETKWFLMSCDPGQALVPQVAENIEEARWFTVHQLDEVLRNTYANLVDFLTKTLPVT